MQKICLVWEVGMLSKKARSLELVQATDDKVGSPKGELKIIRLI
jgi:hypothetical protein